MHRSHLFSALAALLFAAAASATPGEPLGPAFQVNGLSTAQHEQPAVARRGNGEFVVVWSRYLAGDAQAYTVQARRYAADGSPLGAEFRVDSDSSGTSPGAPQVAMADDGRFVVAWTQSRYAPSQQILLRRFAANGLPLAAVERVNVAKRDPVRVYDAQLAMSADGRHAVLWKEDRLDPELDLPEASCYFGCLATDVNVSRLYLRRYAADGSGAATQTVDSALRLSTGLAGPRLRLLLGAADEIGDYRLAMSADARIAVSWKKTASLLLGSSTPASSSLQLRRYGSDGRAAAVQRLLSLDNSSCSGPDDLGSDAGGGLMLLYTRQPGASCNEQVAQWFNDQGQRQGAAVNLVDSGADGSSYWGALPRLAMNAAGNSVVVGSQDSQLRGQRFALGGGKLGLNFQFGSVAFQPSIDLASDAQGDFVVVWPAGGQILAQRFDGP